MHPVMVVKLPNGAFGGVYHALAWLTLLPGKYCQRCRTITGWVQKAFV